MQPLETPVSRQNMLGNDGIAWNTTIGPMGLERALKSIEENTYIDGMWGCRMWLSVKQLLLYIQYIHNVYTQFPTIYAKHKDSHYYI